jgi:hypothetical protein
MRNFLKTLTQRWFAPKATGVRSAGFLLAFFLALHTFQLSVAPHHEWVHFAKANASASAWDHSGFDCDECLFSHTIVNPTPIRDSVRDSWGQFELLAIAAPQEPTLKAVFSNVQARAPPIFVLI